MVTISEIVGLLNNGAACGDADSEQEVIALMSDGTYRAMVLPYQQTAAYARCDNWAEGFDDWSNCYNMVLETCEHNYNIRNTPVVTLRINSSYDQPIDIYGNYHYDCGDIAVARIDATHFVLIDVEKERI